MTEFNLTITKELMERVKYCGTSLCKSTIVSQSCILAQALNDFIGHNVHTAVGGDIVEYYSGPIAMKSYVDSYGAKQLIASKELLICSHSTTDSMKNLIRDFDNRKFKDSTGTNLSIILADKDILPEAAAAAAVPFIGRVVTIQLPDQIINMINIEEALVNNPEFALVE